MIAMRAVATLSLAFALGVATACGGGNKPANEPAPVASASAAPAPTTPACSDAPVNPAEVIAKEPAVFSACFAPGGKLDPNLCGQAKIAVEIGKDGRVSRAEVASSSLPQAVTDCLKARLSAIQYACPKEGSGTYTVPFGLPIGSPTGACPGLPAPASSP